MRLRGRPLRPLPIAVFVVSCAWALSGNLAANTLNPGRPWWPVAVWAGFAVLTVLSFVLQVAGTGQAAAAPTLTDAARALADRVKAQLQREPTIRQVRQPSPIAVRWASTGRPVAASRHAVMGGDPGVDWADAPLAGDLGDLVDTFDNRLPHRQLVVLGAPGAGKSTLAMLLTLAKVEHPAPGAAVPLLLPIASWNPSEEPIEKFLSRGIRELLSWDARNDLPDRLVADGRILPVLDGLDELPAAGQIEAVIQLNDWATADRPLVLTCRSTDYERMFQHSGLVLAKAAVVEIHPVSTAQAIEFLSEPAASRTRWNPVLHHIQNHPHGDLAQVLATPLMVSIARTAYRQPFTNPSALLELGNRELIVKRLFDAFLDSAYPATATNTTIRRRTRALTWLEYLAFQLSQSGTRDWQWSILKPEVPLSRPMITRSRLAAWPMLIMVPVTMGLAVAKVSGVNIPAWLFLPLSAGPWVISTYFRGFLKRAAVIHWSLALIATAIAATVVGKATDLLSSRHDLGAFGNGVFAVLYVVGIQDMTLTAIQLPPRSRTGWIERAAENLFTVGFVAFAGLLSGAVAGAPLTGLLAGTVYALLTHRMPIWSWAPRQRRVTPWATAVQHGFLAGALMTAGVALTATSGASIRAGLLAALLYGGAAAYWTGLRTWIRFRLAHVALAVQGWLPWRLRGFLNDAHRRQVLRQVGNAWQFRHAMLQDHLAERLWEQQLRNLSEGNTDESTFATLQLANILAENGEVDQAIAMTRRIVDSDDLATWDAAEQLPTLLTRFGRVDELRELTAHAYGYLAHHASLRLADLLVRQGNLDEVIALLRSATKREGYAGEVAEPLCQALAVLNRLDELRALCQEADAIALPATKWLAVKLAEQGRTAEAIALLDARLTTDGGPAGIALALADLLVAQGQPDEAIGILSRGASSDNTPERVARRLAGLLADQSRWDELRTHAGGTDRNLAAYATRHLAEALVRREKIEEAIALMHGHLVLDDRRYAKLTLGERFGDETSAALLADLLVQTGRGAEAIELLRARTSKHNERWWAATRCLVDTLVRLGGVDEAVAVLRKHVLAADVRSADAAKLLAELSVPAQAGLAGTGVDERAVAGGEDGDDGGRGEQLDAGGGGDAGRGAVAVEGPG